MPSSLDATLPEDSNNPETMLAQLIERHTRGEEVDFEFFLARYPQMRKALSVLGADIGFDSARLAPVTDEEDLFSKLRQLYGSEFAPEISLTPRPEGPGNEGDDAPEPIQWRSPQSRFRVLRRLGKGGMGEVFEVWDEGLRRRLALKTIRHDGAGQGSKRLDSRTLGRFLEEAQITGQLDHPGILPVHELGLDEKGGVFFTMSVVEGRHFGDILELVERGEENWTRERALGVILRVSEAVAYAHSKGVIHRDIKPSNVMIGRFGQTYVMDWGLAKILGTPLEGDRLHAERPQAVRGSRSQETMDGQVIGTPIYMSPEQAHGRLKDIGPTSDIYSVGSLLYHLLAGHGPYVVPGASLSTSRALEAVKQGPPAPIDARRRCVPPELVAVCDKAMARDIDERYASAQDLATDLRAFLEDRVVQAYRTGAWAELGKWVQRNRGMARALLALLLITLSAFAFFMWLKEDQAQRLGVERDKQAKISENLEVTNANLQSTSEKLASTNRELEQEQRTTQTLLDLAQAKLLLHQEREGSFYPPDDEGQRKMAQWIATVTDMATRRDGYERLAASTTNLDEKTQLSELVEDIDILAQLEKHVAIDLEIAQEEETFTVDEHAEAWEICLSDLEGNETYAGLSMDPQIGLVPIGRDPKSGLWEFWHPNSGEPPLEIQGEHRLGPKSGIIFVLVPGGSLTLKGQRLTVEPFFISKYELTRAQWHMARGTDPLDYHLPRGGYPKTIDDPLRPVSAVTWTEVDLYARMMHVSLPTEIQWEYASRAGSGDEFVWGDEEEALRDRENIADQSYARQGTQVSAPWDDGSVAASIVGSYAPNPWGLYDVLGNVSEWCRDLYAENYLQYLTLDVHEMSPAQRRGSVRGGSFHSPPKACGVSFRQSHARGGFQLTIGVRLARDIREP